jgi:GAF domain-containing protein
MAGHTDAGDLREQRLVATFVELADPLVEDFDLVEFLATLTDRVVELGLAHEAGILLVDEAGDLQFVAASHERAHLLELFQVQNHEGPCQDCFTTGQAVAVDDIAAETERWPLFAERALASGFRSVQAVPLRLRGTVLGALNLFLTETGGVTEGGLEIVQAMADVASIGLLQQRELHRSHDVEAQLQHALHSRIGVEQAKGIVSEQASLPMDEAFELLRSHARRSNEKLSGVARSVVEGTLSAADLAPTAG